MNVAAIPFTMTVFAKTDSDIGFEHFFCTEATLFATVYKAMFMEEIDERHREEVQCVVDELLEKGDADFEDGWIAMRRGVAGAVDWMLDRIKTEIADKQFEGQRGYEAHQRAESAAERYRQLREVLVDALGPQADTVLSAATAN